MYANFFPLAFYYREKSVHRFFNFDQKYYDLLKVKYQKGISGEME